MCASAFISIQDQQTADIESPSINRISSNPSICFVGGEEMATVDCSDDDRSKSSVRVFVVEDHEPFRRFICSTLAERMDLQIVGEVSDGLEAVHKAQELQPDLILLDIGLPSLNGIEAARQIRKLSPKSKILFVSQESSADVVQGAFSLGAAGYLVKTHAAIELLAAVEAVSQGKQFVSSGLAGHIPAELADGQLPKRLHSDDVVALPSDAGDD
jgi:DNA-binding NarL/FixJ family response regulator